MRDKNIVTNPSIHTHPGMVLTHTSARGAGMVFTLGFLAVSAFFVRPTLPYLAVFAGMLLISAIGLLDDYQNAHPYTKARFLEKPAVRLVILIIIASIIPLSNIKIDFVSNPLGGIFYLNQIGLFDSALFTIVWIVWILNLLSWSNGVDGQYSGMITIVGIVIGILALRYTPVQSQYYDVAKLSFILAGASLGLLPYGWHPSKIMWGFGAMSAGLAIATFSILIKAKVTTSVLIVLIPFLDASITLIRRILQGKNPLKGDSGHLHHLLMKRGWSVPKISLFYWFTTAVFGVSAIFFSDRSAIQGALVLIGGVAFFIVIMNLLALKHSQRSQLTEK